MSGVKGHQLLTWNWKKSIHLFSALKDASKPVLTLFTKKSEPCSLCDEAKQVLDKYSAEFVYEEQNIDDPGNEEWMEKYRYDIPVIHMNGSYLMKHRVNERLLRQTLDNLRNNIGET